MNIKNLGSRSQYENNPFGPGGKVLYVKAPISPERMLLTRFFIVLSLFFIVILVLWFDREGLNDQLDGHISFADIVYFAMITITTVGYGDIVPVAGNTRIVDALFICLLYTSDAADE